MMLYMFRFYYCNVLTQRMQILVYFIVLQSAFSAASKSRSVNLALETVLEFDQNDDVAFIDTMQAFLDKIKRTVIRNRATDNYNTYEQENNATDEKQVKFTDFLAETATVLQSYNDDDLKEFFRTLDNEIEIRRKDYRFRAIADAVGFRRLVNTKLKDLKEDDSSASDIRRKLNDISNKLRLDERYSSGNLIADFLNFFYRKKSQAKLSRFLNNLKLYRKRARRSFNLDLKKIIRNGFLALIDPFLELNANINDEATKLHVSQISVNSNIEEIDNSGSNIVKHKKGKSNYIIHKKNNMAAKDDKQNEILDYIENQKSVIDKHISNDGYLTNSKENSNSKYYNSAVTKYSYSEKNKNKIKSKYNDLRGGVEAERKKTKRKYTTVKTTKDANLKRNRKSKPKTESNKEGNIDLSEVDEPILITIGSSDESNLETEDDYESRTQRTKQRRYKKFTRRSTTKKRFSEERPRKFARKQFRTTLSSDEGLSIEHFGSLVDKKPMRKSNNNDNIVVNRTLLFEETGHDEETTLMRRYDKLSSKTVKYNLVHNINEFTERVERKLKEKPLDLDIITENIRLKGDIIIESTTKNNQRNKNSQANPSKDKTFVELRKIRTFNATTTTTRNLNAGEIKPTTVFRTQNPNETEIKVTTSTSPKIDIVTSIKTTVNKTEINTEKMRVKANDDNLENELENMIEKYNKSSTLPADMENFLQESKNNNKDRNNNDIQKQMKLDFQKLFGPTTTPSSKNVVTEMFTDPFKDIDDALDPY